MFIVSPHATHLLLRPSWWRAHLLQILPLLNLPRERQRAQELREIASQGGEGTIVRERLIERELRGESGLDQERSVFGGLHACVAANLRGEGNGGGSHC